MDCTSLFVAPGLILFHSSRIIDFSYCLEDINIRLTLTICFRILETSSFQICSTGLRSGDCGGPLLILGKYIAAKVEHYVQYDLGHCLGRFWNHFVNKIFVLTMANSILKCQCSCIDP